MCNTVLIWGEFIFDVSVDVFPTPSCICGVNRRMNIHGFCKNQFPFVSRGGGGGARRHLCPPGGKWPKCRQRAGNGEAQTEAASDAAAKSRRGAATGGAAGWVGDTVPSSSSFTRNFFFNFYGVLNSSHDP